MGWAVPHTDPYCPLLANPATSACASLAGERRFPRCQRVRGSAAWEGCPGAKKGQRWGSLWGPDVKEVTWRPTWLEHTGPVPHLQPRATVCAQLSPPHRPPPPTCPPPHNPPRVPLPTTNHLSPCPSHTTYPPPHHPPPLPLPLPHHLSPSPPPTTCPPALPLPHHCPFLPRLRAFWVLPCNQLRPGLSPKRHERAWSI